MTGDLVGTRCAICDRLAPITVADVIGRERSDDDPTSYAGWSIEGFLAREAMPTSPPSGENMLIMIPPGAAWMNVPDAIDTEPDPRARDEQYDETNRPEFDPERIMCSAHASEVEKDAWLDRLNETARLTGLDKVPGQDDEDEPPVF